VHLINPARKVLAIDYTKMSHAESVQMELIQGKCEDIYYPNPETTRKECIPTKQTTKYVQAFNSLGAGTNTFLIPANFGLQQVCIQMRLPSLTSSGGTGLAINRGWGYGLIKQVSYRIGGSTQFFVTGAQLLQHALKRMTNQQAKDDLLTLGGAYITGTGFESTSITSASVTTVVPAQNYAYVFLDLPFTRATSEGMPAPLPSDVLGSNVQITVELAALSDLVVNNGGTASNLATLASAQFQVQQVLMASRDDSLAVRENMATHQLVYPVEFVQQEQVVSVQNTASVQSVTATGFRAGSVKSIECWLTRDSWADGTGLSVAGASPAGIVVGGKNPLKWIAPQAVTCTYAGDVYARFDAGMSQLWNLVNSKHSPYVNAVDLSYASSTYTSTGTQYQWATLPFAQTYDVADTSDFMLVEGLAVTNGIVNISFQIPPIYQAYGSTTNDWKLHLSYIYNASAVFSQSSCELVF
jgi:hypothetical protein